MELIARYGDLPEVLAPFCETAPMQRLQKVGMHCGCEYTACPIYEGKAPYSRYLHSLGAAAIVWHFTKDAAQSLSALFHDIATPAFAHVVDFLNEDHLRQESTEAPTHEILAGDTQIQALLRPLGLCTHDVDDYHRYPIADNDSPRLSSDRLEYTLGNAYRVFGATLGEISAVYGDLFAAAAEDGLPELSFRNLEAAQTFSRWSLRQSQWFVSDDDRFFMQALADLLRFAIRTGVLTKDDLLRAEPDVLTKLTADPVCARFCTASVVENENGTGCSSPGCSSILETSTERRLMRGGVPVLNRRMRSPKAFRHSVSPMPACMPSGPEE